MYIMYSLYVESVHVICYYVGNRNGYNLRKLLCFQSTSNYNCDMYIFIYLRRLLPVEQEKNIEIYCILLLNLSELS